MTPDRAKPAAAGVLRVGTQGWNYDAWVGPFYPTGTRPANYLQTYARAFNTVEVDSTFYAVPPMKTVQGWRQRTPEGFTFALKLPQEITHELRLRNAEEPSARFFDAARELGPKLGPVLIQQVQRAGQELAAVGRAGAAGTLAPVPLAVDGVRVVRVGARRVVEVGTFTGYSALCVAEALPAVRRAADVGTRAAGTSGAGERLFWRRREVSQGAGPADDPMFAIRSPAYAVSLSRRSN